MTPSTPPGDWEVVEDALGNMPHLPTRKYHAVNAALARLREREARWERTSEEFLKNWGHWQNKQAETQIELMAAEARVARLEEALRSLEAEGWFAAWSDDLRVQVIRRALAHEEEKT